MLVFVASHWSKKLYALWINSYVDKIGPRFVHFNLIQIKIKLQPKINRTNWYKIKINFSSLFVQHFAHEDSSFSRETAAAASSRGNNNSKFSTVRQSETERDINAYYKRHRAQTKICCAIEIVALVFGWEKKNRSWQKIQIGKDKQRKHKLKCATVKRNQQKII